ncbi:hypothetical protein R5R35_000203 [Gryllus longicercus]|uniref:inositol-phosphate phosphatase n=1 Tax=Gryllus longicercus TaxID=2509291 RepID=A0AAN9WS08_9ORTH
MNFGGTIRINKFGLCIIIGACILLFYYLNSESKSAADDIKHEQGNTINLKRLLIAAIEVAEKGGKEVHDIRQQDDVKERSKGKLQGGVNDPLTLADDKSHCIMYYSLKQNFPKLKVISEEKSEDCQEVPPLDFDLQVAKDVIEYPDDNVSVDDITVWIDPLDATKEYTENLLKYVTTMVCVAVKGKPVIGVIHKPFDEKLSTYWAWVEKGLSRNLNLDVPVESKLKIIVSMSHAGEVANITEKAFDKSVEIVQAAGAGYKALEVVERRAAAYLHVTNIKKWDVCAGNAIVNAAKGKMTTLKGDELDYSNDKDVVNRDGLLATRDKHEWFLGRLTTVMSKA